MKYRKNIRLKNYDYSTNGYYFVTICTCNRKCLFGKIIVGAGSYACPKMILNDAGRMIAEIWHQIPEYYAGNDIDEFVVMPNHIHGIIIVKNGRTVDKNGQPQGVAPTVLSLPDIVHRFKTMTTKKYTDGVKQLGWQPFYGKLWQRNYFEHITRNENDLKGIREYIRNNPANWETDDEFCKLHG
ncbi:MAG: transposase [Elusimicrobiota bacterium]|nr:transposase [Elusimicrobiota bacterium]